MERVALSLGSNLGLKMENIARAFDNLSEFLICPSISKLYETKPLYVTAQPEFINAVTVGYTDLSPIGFLNAIQQVENELGRNRHGVQRMGPRRIDIDIILFGERIVTLDQLSIPHPKLMERKFVLIPLLELEPQVCNPHTGEPYWKILQKLENQGIYYHSFHRYSK